MAPRKKTTPSPCWIGLPETAGPMHGRKNQTAYFTYAFHGSKTCSLSLRISANSRYRLWFNGKAIGSGPLKGDAGCWYYDEYDLTEQLRQGNNVLAVKVVAYPSYAASATGNYGPLSIMSNGAGPYLMIDGRLTGARGRALAELTTGHAPWLAAPDRAVDWELEPMSFWMGAMERVDGRSLPQGWPAHPEPEGFTAAEVLWPAYGSPSDRAYGLIPPLPLQARTLPLLYEIPGQFAQTMPHKDADRLPIPFDGLTGEAILAPNAAYSIELDAQVLKTGFFVLPMGGGADSRIRIRYAESYYQYGPSGPVKGRRDDAAGTLIGHEDHYIVSGREVSYEPFWFHTFRFVRIEADIGDTPLTLGVPWYLETGYPLAELSEIQSSTNWAEPVWDISLRTLKRCMHETYEDCPYYEQLQYTMDTRLQILFTYMVSGDTRLAERAMEDYHRSLLPEGILQSRYPSLQPQVIPGFSIFFILMLEDYHWQTGEAKFIRRYRPTVDAILEWFHRRIGKDGLLEHMGYWEFADWVEGWERGVPRACRLGPSTIHNLLYAYGLQRAARLNRITGRRELATEYEKRANDILYRVDIACWSDQAGLYTEGPGFVEYSQHAQVFAVLTGMARGKRAKSILKKAMALEDIAQCSYAMKFYLFRALETAGLYDWTDALWQDWKGMLDLGLTTCPEDFVGVRSDCHGWSALPLYEFTRCILGVKPTAPGWEKIRIEPKVLSFADFSGKVITPKGLVTVGWKKSDAKFMISGRVPDGIPFELCLPDGTEQIYLQGGPFEF